MKAQETKRRRLEVLCSQLETERASFLPSWRDVGDYVLPRRPRFTVTDVNRGDRRNQKIIDSTGTLAARTLESGMMGGLTSPARPWFKLTVDDPELAETGSVKEWLEIVTTRMANVFLRSNLYPMLSTLYGDLGVFGTAAIFMEEDFENVVHFTDLPIGSYAIGSTGRGKVDILVRSFQMTVRQLVAKFGKKSASGKPEWKNFSNHVRNLWEDGNRETAIEIRHVVMPNEDYDDKKNVTKAMKYTSCYYERGGGHNSSYLGDDDRERYLRESGYNYFPALVPRWKVTGEDTYGTSSPGMDALGDIRQLQVMEKRALQAIEKKINPPVKGPSALKNQSVSLLPGGITYTDSQNGGSVLEPIHEVQFSLKELDDRQLMCRQRISRCFYEDLFLMLQQSDRREITAREIEERHEEKLLALGPVLERLNQDLYDPLIDNTFEFMDRQRLIPPAPEEMQGMKLKVEYVSVLQQAQKLYGIANLERFSAWALQIATVDPSILDKWDLDQHSDVYGDQLSLPSGVIRPDEIVEKLRAQKQQAMQAAQAAELANQGAQAAKNLAQADTSGQNALTDLMAQAEAGEMV